MSEPAVALRDTAESPVPHRLNLGCGLKRRDDCLNVDRIARVCPDLLWDLDEYPLPKSHFRFIFVHDVVEHNRRIPDFMAEVHRIAEPGGVVEITTPHFSNANSYTDPTHLHHLGFFSFDYFTSRGDLDYYSDARFQIVGRQIVFRQCLLNGVVSGLANSHPMVYEQRFAWMFPAWFLIFRLAALK